MKTKDIEELEYALIQATNDNLELVEKCEKLTKKNEELKNNQITIEMNREYHRALSNSIEKDEENSRISDFNDKIWEQNQNFQKEIEKLTKENERLETELVKLRQSGNKLMDSSSLEIARLKKGNEELKKRGQTVLILDKDWGEILTFQSKLTYRKKLIRSLKKQRLYFIVKHSKDKLSLEFDLRNSQNEIERLKKENEELKESIQNATLMSVIGWGQI